MSRSSEVGGVGAALVAVALVTACGQADTPAREPVAAPAAVTPGRDAAAPATVAAVIDAGAAPVVAVAPVDAAAGPPPDAAPAIETWPFTAWNRAAVFTFNHVDYGPGIPLRVYDAEHGWSPNVVSHEDIVDHRVADEAVALVALTRGELEVSKCAFPRHAIVFYAGDTPVGSVNVCFSCGDILVWPDFEPGPDWNDDSKAGVRRRDKLMKQKLSGYKQAFPRWEKLFRDTLGLPLEPPPGVEH